MSASTEHLTDRIYEAALLPDLWPEVLDEICGAIGMAGGVLFAAHGRAMNWTSSPRLAPIMQAFIDDGWAARNLRAPRALLRPGVVLTDLDVATREELDNDPMYRELLRPAGLGWAAGLAVPVPTGDVLVFSMEQWFDRGPISREMVARLEELRPHLARSGLVSARLGLARLDASVDALEAVGLPAAVIGAGGRVLATNTGFQREAGGLRWRAQDRIALSDKSADGLLQTALRDLRRDGETTRSIAVRGTEERTPLVLHIVPLRRSAYDLFTGADALLVATPLSKSSAPPAELLNALFDLTPAEARVARAIVAGQSVNAIAAAGSQSVETVRSHVRAILGKTGVNRQAELITLLSTAARVAPGDGLSPGSRSAARD